jgi:hypothetical protein
MKKILTNINFVIIVTFFVNVCINAQTSEANVKSALSSVFDVSVKEDFSKAAGLMLYEDGKEKRAYNSSDNSELKTVKRQCKKIKAYIDLSDSYEYANFSTTQINGMNGAVLEVIFKSGDQKLNISFSFVNLSGKLLLASFK